jgi:hypothetical protein
MCQQHPAQSKTSCLLNFPGSARGEEHPLPWKGRLGYITGGVDEESACITFVLVTSIMDQYPDGVGVQGKANAFAIFTASAVESGS